MLAAYIVQQGRIPSKRRKGGQVGAGPSPARQAALKTTAFLANAKIVDEGMHDIAGGRTVPWAALFESLVLIRDLRFCLAGDMSGRAEVVRIADAVWRGVKVVRGPKLTLVSATHEYFLESQSIFRDAAFTWAPEDEDFTDRLTIATREEFDDPNFNPVTARRRQRAKKRQSSAG